MMDDVTEEEMARVLRRHLVPRRIGAEMNSGNGSGEGEEGGSQKGEDSGSSEEARSKQVVSGNGQQDEDDEPFPIPYDAPGGDITYVFSSCLWSEFHSTKAMIFLSFILFNSIDIRYTSGRRANGVTHSVRVRTRSPRPSQSP